ncbi:MAG: hypothetical protein AABO58_25755 [Acidobacteriota bacterium]
MTRSIGAVSHGILDYALAIILAIGPSVAGFRGSRQERLCYIFAAVLFVLALLTQMKFVRLPVHGAIELVLAILLILLPWIANFSRGVNSRNFYVAVGILMIVLWALTDFRGRRGVPVADRGAGPGGGGP